MTTPRPNAIYRRALSALTFAMVMAAPASQAANLQFHWEDRFKTSDQAKLVEWLTETHDALQALVGQLPMTTHLFIHRAAAREPVPWANTQRSSQQGVHFHVDPSFSLDEFRRDWTAPHELSHLVLPYVGREHSWFAEGFASYMQYQVMQAMGVLSPAEAATRYRRNHERAARKYPFASQPFASSANRLRARRDYPTMYWGGAAYFQQVAGKLAGTAQHGPALMQVLRRYIACCRKNRDGLGTLVTRLDGVAGAKVFSEVLHTFKTVPGFPATGDL